MKSIPRYKLQEAKQNPAFSSCRVRGILFQDYINHTHAEGDTTALAHFDRLFDAGKLVVLSKIEHRNISVKPLR